MGTTWSTCRHLQFQKVSIETQEEELEEEEEQEEEGEGEEVGGPRERVRRIINQFTPTFS